MTKTTVMNAYGAAGAVIFTVMLAVGGCAGGYGENDTASTADTPAFQAESEGQRLMLEKTQARNAMDKVTQSPDASVPESAAKKPCEGFPGFDRGCPNSGK